MEPALVGTMAGSRLHTFHRAHMVVRMDVSSTLLWCDSFPSCTASAMPHNGQRKPSTYANCDPPCVRRDAVQPTFDRDVATSQSPQWSVTSPIVSGDTALPASEKHQAHQLNWILWLPGSCVICSCLICMLGRRDNVSLPPRVYRHPLLTAVSPPRPFPPQPQTAMAISTHFPERAGEATFDGSYRQRHYYSSPWASELRSPVYIP